MVTLEKYSTCYWFNQIIIIQQKSHVLSFTEETRGNQNSNLTFYGKKNTSMKVRKCSKVNRFLFLICVENRDITNDRFAAHGTILQFSRARLTACEMTAVNEDTFDFAIQAYNTQFIIRGSVRRGFL